MSRYTATGYHPDTGLEVSVAFGWDQVPGYKPGYFFQVFDSDNPDEAIINEGFMDGISGETLDALMLKWKVFRIRVMQRD